jgi:hypothetical protein
MNSVEPEGASTQVGEIITVASVGAISRDADPPLLRVRTGRGIFERPSSAQVLKPLHGFEFVVEGEVIDDSGSSGPAQLWKFEPREWDGLQLDGFTLKLLRMAISWPGAPLRFEWEWLEGQYVRGLPHVTQGGAMPKDYHRLADAFQALLKFTENLRRGGGRPRGATTGKHPSAREIWSWSVKFEEADGVRPKIKDLADYMEVSRETARKRLHDVGQTWPPKDPRRRT